MVAQIFSIYLTCHNMKNYVTWILLSAIKLVLIFSSMNSTVSTDSSEIFECSSLPATKFEVLSRSQSFLASKFKIWICETTKFKSSKSSTSWVISKSKESSSVATIASNFQIVATKSLKLFNPSSSSTDRKEVWRKARSSLLLNLQRNLSSSLAMVS